MYIINKTKKYPCTGYHPGAQDVRFDVEGVTLPISGMVTLSDEDAFELAAIDCGDYARQTYVDGVLTLTNEPERPPQPEPTPQPAPPSITDIAEMMIDHETRLSLVEMGVK